MIALRQLTRLRAASLHLVLSATIGAVAVVLMLALWYPPPFFFAMGGSELAMLIIGVDVAIGPLVTLIIFDTRKKELAFDLSVIGVLQIAALAYGMHAMYWGRPVFTVFAEDRFAVVSAAEIDPEQLAKAGDAQFRRLSLTGPMLVAAKPPSDPDELSTIAFMALTGHGLQHLPRYFVPYAEMKQVVIATSRPLAELNPGAEDKEKLDQYLSSGRSAATLRCLPVITKRAPLTAVIDGGTGELVDILDIRPVLAT